jgi:hypothetical protein
MHDRFSSAKQKVLLSGLPTFLPVFNGQILDSYTCHDMIHDTAMEAMTERTGVGNDAWTNDHPEEAEAMTEEHK